MTTAAPTTTRTARTATTTRPTPEQLRALARCVGDAEAFLERRFTVEPALHEGEGYDDLLSLADVDRQLTGGGLRQPAVRLVKDGDILPASSFTRRARTGTTEITDLLDTARALDLFADGATIVLQSLHRWWPPLAAFCRDLETVLGHPAQANAYLTPAGAAGLAPHHDTHDVFVLQVAGTKHWTLRDPLVEAPLPRHRSDHGAAAALPVRQEVDLRPGDCLYLPRGFVHSATAQASTSLHLTIGVLTTTVHDVLRALVERAAEVPTFRRTLPPAFATTDDAGGAVVAGVVTELVEWLGQVDPTPVADELRDRFWSSRRPLLDGQLLELTTLDEIDDGTTVRRRSATTCRLSTDDGELVVRLGDRRLVLPAVLTAVVEQLVDGEPHRVGELADRLDERSRLVLVRRLVREGVLHRVA